MHAFARARRKIVYITYSIDKQDERIEILQICMATLKSDLFFVSFLIKHVSQSSYVFIKNKSISNLKWHLFTTNNSLNGINLIFSYNENNILKRKRYDLMRFSNRILKMFSLKKNWIQIKPILLKFDFKNKHSLL